MKICTEVGVDLYATHSKCVADVPSLEVLMSVFKTYLFYPVPAQAQPPPELQQLALNFLATFLVVICTRPENFSYT